MMEKIFVLLAALSLICSAGWAATPDTTTTQIPVMTIPTTQSPTTVPETTVPEINETEPVQTTLIDNENCVVIIKGYDEDALLGYSVNVFLENKTDKELMFSLDEVSVNGFMCDPFWASAVSAGKKANEQITFLSSDFEINGIEEVDEITFTLRVYDSNDWLADPFVEETFTVHP